MLATTECCSTKFWQPSNVAAQALRPATQAICINTKNKHHQHQLSKEKQSREQTRSIGFARQHQEHQQNSKNKLYETYLHTPTPATPRQPLEQENKSKQKHQYKTGSQKSR
ncbi:hypothetical protein M758_UG253400 [Ceratodon purpureus]|nr:hypothetical protein M758_UG253400 [Ceratodon purpureus]